MEKLKALMRADIPVLLWGPPGTGKTAIVQALAASEHAHLETLIAAQCDQTDIAGIPCIIDGKVSIAAPAWAMRCKEALDAGKQAWLFLDEISCASAGVQAALLRVVHERRVSEVDLSGCKIIAAANPADTAADGGYMSAAMRSRWAHIEHTIDAQKWCDGELRGWGLQRNAAQQQLAAHVVSFISANRDALLQEPSDDASQRAYATPRGWSHLVRTGATVDILPAVAAALVGDAAAGELVEYIDAMDLPAPADILSGRAKMPERSDQLYAALTSVVSYVYSTEQQCDIDAAWRILSEQRIDVAMTPARQLLQLSSSNLPDCAHALAQKVQELTA